MYSLVATAKRHEVEPFAYLKNVLSRIPDHPHHTLADLLPQNWVQPQRSKCFHPVSSDMGSPRGYR
ncbi:MAG: transposase domain-containing protein [candidate division KSB1 bacterium]